MEEIFKQKLLRLRQPLPAKTFAEALMGESPFQALKRRPTPVPRPEGFSEKKQVIESLERFVEEKVKDAPEPVLKLDGGEVAVKKDPVWDIPGIAKDLAELRSGLTLATSLLEIILRGKDPAKVRVLFVTERFRDPAEVTPELRGGFIDELLTGFPAKTAELFERMILAMKLTPDEVLLYPVEIGEEARPGEAVSLGVFFSPEVVVTLGAKATNAILKGNDRLSQIHGQFFQRSVQGAGTFQVVPLFHPSIIETNQNMKKTAWSDMQKIMKVLKKLS
jgi:hypothetical protein